MGALFKRATTGARAVDMVMFIDCATASASSPVADTAGYLSGQLVRS